VTNEAASLELVASLGSVTYLYIEKLDISVFKAATGGGGEIIIKDTDGGVVWRINADGVKDMSLSWGDNGLRVGPGVGLQAVTANAGGEQAEASVSVAGHTSTF
jgi:hypothetical protein